MNKTSNILLFGLFILTACSAANSSSAPSAATLPPQPTATEMKVFPTPSSPGDTITWNGLQVTMDQLEINQQYMTDFGSTRIPPPGSKFLWVHVQLKNIGKVQMDVPISEHFSVLYAATELKPTYGHRAGSTEYPGLDAVIFPDQQLDGWLRFDIPTTAELNDLRFVFLPESSRVGASFSSPNYPYSDDKPTYVWTCKQQ